MQSPTATFVSRWDRRKNDQEFLQLSLFAFGQIRLETDYEFRAGIVAPGGAGLRAGG
jgi:hypothetical protein